MKTTFTNAFENGDFAKKISMSANYELTADEKGLFISFVCSAASKTLTLGLETGDAAIVTNIGGTNAVTVKNVSGDTGTSLAAGKSALIIASVTADASTVIALN